LSHILIADDDHGVLAALKLLLKSEGFEVTIANQPGQVIELVKQKPFDCALIDLNYQLDTTSGAEGLDLVSAIRAEDESLPIVCMTGWATVELAVKAMQQGAGDFVQKPWENERLLSILNNQIALGRVRLQSQKLATENQLLKSQHSSELIAESPAMKQLLQTVAQVASTDINILITGDNGTGKTALAQYIHQSSNRAEEPFINVNMGAISENLFESEMFGHVKGAFTDAKQARIGRFELADGGSLFFDEIGNIPLSQQAKLLRVLEQQEFEKVGSSQTQQVNVRMISATNADLQSMVAEGVFRQDLLFRLNSFTIHLPSLKQRLEDIPALASHFLQQFMKQHQRQVELTEAAIKALQTYDWPGNVRELRHVLERAVILSQHGTIEPAQLQLMPQGVAPSNSPASAQSFDDDATLDEIEKQVIAERIKSHDGNMQETAKSLGLSRSAFYRRLEKYGL